MQIGYNNDIKYRGLTLHIQTEDHGLSAKKITSQIFHSGAIVDSSTVSYEDEIAEAEDNGSRDEIIRGRMREIHKGCFKRILKGEYDDKLPIEEKAAPSPPASDERSEAVEEFEPETLYDDADLPSEADEIAPEGFEMAGELEKLGAMYERKSRGEPMSFEELSGDDDIEDFVESMVTEAITALGQDQVVDRGPEVAAQVDSARRAKSAPASITVSDVPAWRGVEEEEDTELAGMLLDALGAR